MKKCMMIVFLLIFCLLMTSVREIGADLLEQEAAIIEQALQESTKSNYRRKLIYFSCRMEREVLLITIYVKQNTMRWNRK